MRTSQLLLALPAVAAFGFACGGPAEETVADTDGDGLADTYEESIGSDPDKGDSDGDGWSDDEEVWGHADPTDETSHPYLGGWERRPYPADLEEQTTGSAAGDLAPNFALIDQYDEPVDLYSFYGNVVLLDFSAFW